MIHHFNIKVQRFCYPHIIQAHYKLLPATQISHVLDQDPTAMAAMDRFARCTLSAPTNVPTSHRVVSPSGQRRRIDLWPTRACRKNHSWHATVGRDLSVELSSFFFTRLCENCPLQPFSFWWLLMRMCRHFHVAALTWHRLSDSAITDT